MDLESEWIQLAFFGGLFIGVCIGAFGMVAAEVIAKWSERREHEQR